MVSDKLYQTLDRDVASCTCIRQCENRFKLPDLAKECNIFSVSKRKAPSETHPFTREKIIKNRDKNNFFKESKEHKIPFNPKKKKIFICSGEHFAWVCPIKIGKSNPEKNIFQLQRMQK